jgi:pyruvate dehydrogenase E1 component
VPDDPAARERRRRLVVAGGYHLRKALGTPAVTIAATGAVITEALQAAQRLDALGAPADVICITSADLLYRALQASRDPQGGPTWILKSLFPTARRAPLVTVLDGHPHTLAFLSEITGTPGRHLGVTTFGQSGDLDTVYRYHHINADSIISAALDLTP